MKGFDKGTSSQQRAAEALENRVINRASLVANDNGIESLKAAA